MQDKYIEYIKYSLLPSMNIYKIQSCCLSTKIEKLMQNSLENTISFVIMYDGNPKRMILDEDLLDLAIYTNPSDRYISEIILTIKKIENNHAR